MKAIFSLERIYNLSGAMFQIRVKILNKVLFRITFNPNLKTI